MRHGVAIVTDPEDDVRAVACPIHQGGVVVAAMAVVGTLRRIPRGPNSPIANYLRTAADKLSGELGSPNTSDEVLRTATIEPCVSNVLFPCLNPVDSRAFLGGVVSHSLCKHQ